MERMTAYRIQVETRRSNEGTGGARGGYQGCGQDRGGGGPSRGRGQVIFYNCRMPGHYAWECQNQMWPSCQYCTQCDHTIEECPVLMANMQENKAQPQHPTQNLQMMRLEHREEDPNVNIILRSGIMTDDDKGKQLEENGWVRKAPEKEVGFDLERAKETFMEAKKSFIEASTSGSQDKLLETNTSTKIDPSVLTMFLET